MAIGQQSGNLGHRQLKKIIRTWRKQEQQLKEANPSNHNLGRGTANWPELEEELKTWILDQRRSGIIVSTKMIIH
jgi:hypothetical protein